MQVFDASSIVLAWDTYPVSQFPNFWVWIEGLIQAQSIVMVAPNLVEVKQVSPDCHQWLKTDLLVVPIDNQIVQVALSIRSMLGVHNDQYHPKGVDENDILCIAGAKVLGRQLITDEAPQPDKPNDKKKYKIPAVCKHSAVNVDCLNLIEFIRLSGVTF